MTLEEADIELPDILLLQSDAGARLYFVVGTKGTPLVSALRVTEAAKIACGKAHFEALEVREEPAKYRVATTVEELLAGV